jgi:hypothetical protein
MISDEVWDQVREAWYQAIPKQYRNDGKERLNSVNQGDRHIYSASFWVHRRSRYWIDGSRTSNDISPQIN